MVVVGEGCCSQSSTYGLFECVFVIGIMEAVLFLVLARIAMLCSCIVLWCNSFIESGESNLTGRRSRCGSREHSADTLHLCPPSEIAVENDQGFARGLDEWRAGCGF